MRNESSMVEINSNTSPDKNRMLAIFSSIVPGLADLNKDKKESIDATIKKTIAIEASSSIIVVSDLLKKRKEVITKKQNPTRLDDTFSTCGERGSFIYNI